MVDENGKVEKEKLMKGPVFHSKRFRLCPIRKGKPLKGSQSKQVDRFFLLCESLWLSYKGGKKWKSSARQQRIMPQMWGGSRKGCKEGAKTRILTWLLCGLSWHNSAYEIELG